MTYTSKFKAHLFTICQHKYYVLKNCCKAGLLYQGIVHDLSKFHPVEFIESVAYYQGNCSPIDACKELNGMSKAWLHHKVRNRHHYEYWQDNFDNGGISLKMPFEYALELICDYVGAGMAYNKENFSYEQEYNWWKNKCKRPIAMHPQTKMFVEIMLLIMKRENSNDILRMRRARKIYNKANELIECASKGQ